VLERYHAQGDCSVTGGYVVRDGSLPALHGTYVYGDFCTGMLRRAELRRDGVRVDRALGLTVPSLASFGEDGQGRLHAVSLEGDVFRLMSLNGTRGAARARLAPQLEDREDAVRPTAEEGGLGAGAHRRGPFARPARLY
jgi:hypothetical protein